MLFFFRPQISQIEWIIFQPLSVLLSCRIGYAELKVREIDYVELKVGYAELTQHASTGLFNLLNLIEDEFRKRKNEPMFGSR